MKTKNEMPNYRLQQFACCETCRFSFFEYSYEYDGEFTCHHESIQRGVDPRRRKKHQEYIDGIYVNAFGICDNYESKAIRDRLSCVKKRIFGI